MKVNQFVKSSQGILLSLSVTFDRDEISELVYVLEAYGDCSSLDVLYDKVIERPYSLTYTFDLKEFQDIVDSIESVDTIYCLNDLLYYKKYAPVCRAS